MTFEKVLVEKALLIAGGVFALIGLMVIAFFVLYAIFGILDLTYFERHKKKREKPNCPEEIER